MEDVKAGLENGWGLGCEAQIIGVAPNSASTGFNFGDQRVDVDEEKGSGEGASLNGSRKKRVRLR